MTRLRATSGGDVPFTPEEEAERDAEEAAWAAGEPNRCIRRQIAALKASLTQTIIMEAIAGNQTAQATISSVNADVQALEQQLT